MAKTFEEWLGFVKSYTKTNSQADAEAIARALVTNPESSVWHEHSKFYGCTCWCAKCHPGLLFTKSGALNTPPTTPTRRAPRRTYRRSRW